MKKILNYLPIFLAIVLFHSCNVTQDLAYFQDLEANQFLYNTPGKAPEYKISVHDNLFIKIETKDEEANMLYNPNQSRGYYSNTQQMYGDLATQYINSYQVAADGTVTFRTIGAVNLLGLTLEEAQAKIKESALVYLKDPSIQVKTLSFKVNVSGEVASPGIYYTYQGRITILEAISMANGITNQANVKDIIVVRQGKYDTKTFNLNLSTKEVFNSEAFYLQPNDMVYIKPGKYKNTFLNAPTYAVVLSAISTITTLLIATRVYSN